MELDAKTLFTVSEFAVLAAPLTVGLVQILRQAGLPKRITPIASLVVGVGLMSLTSLIWQLVVIQGLLVGLLAVGTFSAVKNTVQG